EAAELALEALKHPVDYYLDYALGETISTLEEQWKPALFSGEPFAKGNPEGIVFLLDRLEPAEVARVPRSEAVNEVLLTRAGIPREVRLEAVEDLAKTRGVSRAEVVLGAIEELEQRSGEGDAEEELSAVLASLPADELRPVLARLETLAGGARHSPFREAAYAALMRAHGSVEPAWKLAGGQPQRMVDLLAGVPLLDDPALQSQLLPRVEALVRSSTGDGPGNGVRARYVRLEQPGCCETQSFADVEGLDGRLNLAPLGEAGPEMTGSGGEAERAIDGNTAGDFRLGSVSQSTAMEADPWWEVDLGEQRSISAVRVWKRTDETVTADIGGFNLFLLDANRDTVRAIEGVDASDQPVTVDLDPDPATEVRRAAVRALIAMQGAGEARLALFGDLLRSGVEADVAFAGIDTVLTSLSPGPQQALLATALLEYARGVEGVDRTGRTFALADTLGRALAAALPEGERARVLKGFEMLQPMRLEIAAVEGAMRFDVEEFT